MSNDTISEIRERPIRWTDKTGVVHACEGSQIHRDVRLVWTLCGRDVPANSAWTPKPGDHYEMCATCNGAHQHKACRSLGRREEN